MCAGEVIGLTFCIVYAVANGVEHGRIGREFPLQVEETEGVACRFWLIALRAADALQNAQAQLQILCGVAVNVAKRFRVLNEQAVDQGF